jgi:hypothetical protein
MGDVDAAWEAATYVLGISPNIVRTQWVDVALEPGIIEWEGHKYMGLTSETVARVVRKPCVLGAGSALIHELAHVALYLQNGDADVGHKHTEWQRIDSLAFSCNQE